MSTRKMTLTCAKIAGYHNDKQTFTRLVICGRVNRQAMNEAWIYGVKAKAAGIKCSCRDCNPTATA